MSEYRNLTQTEIEVLENNVCWAEDWQRVMVADDFKPYNFHRVIFYGDIRLGAFHKMVEVTKGFFKHSGFRTALNAVLIPLMCAETILLFQTLMKSSSWATQCLLYAPFRPAYFANLTKTKFIEKQVHGLLLFISRMSISTAGWNSVKKDG